MSGSLYQVRDRPHHGAENAAARTDGDRAVPFRAASYDRLPFARRLGAFALSPSDSGW
jgi:hypothetical protein